MALWLPVALMAGTVLAVLSQRKSSSKSTCPGLSPEDRAHLDRFLATDPEAILAVGTSQGRSKAQVISAIIEGAKGLDDLGCKYDGDFVRRKADEVSRVPERPAPAGPGTGELSGAFIAPEVQIPNTGNAPGAPTWGGAFPGTTARLDQAFGQAFGGAPAVRSAPLALMRTKARVAIRPEPVAWNDETMGKLGFTVPAGYPVGVIAAGPPACPVGWTKVELQHPEEGIVEGFTEGVNLAPPAPPAPPAPQPKGTPQPMNAQGRTRTRTGAKPAPRRTPKNASAS